MKRIEKIYLVTHRYDFTNLFVCLASIRYWYESIPIVIIKNKNNGEFSLKFLSRYYNVSFINEADFQFGKFYGSLLPFLMTQRERFLIIDTDTAFTGSIIEFLNTKSEDFVLDYEDQPRTKIQQLYWHPDKICNYVKCYNTEWFTFNNGIICGTSGIIKKELFSDFMDWKQNEPPKVKDAIAFPMYDQSAINVVLNKINQSKQASVARQPIMIYPPFFEGNEETLLSQIINRKGDEYRIIHWADQKNIRLRERPMGKIFSFFLREFFNDYSFFGELRLKSLLLYLNMESMLKTCFFRVSAKAKKIAVFQFS